MIYLDNAATTQRKPQCVIDAVCSALQQFGGPGRGAHDAAVQASMALFDARGLVADLFGAQGPARVSFCSNATEALNTVLFSVLTPGDHVITTAAEHNSVLRPLYLLEQRGIIDLTIVDTSEQGYVREENIRTALQSNTKAVVCTHASNVTGNVMDIRKIGALCKDAGAIFIVDAAQSAGLIPISVEQDNIDVLCFTGHKSLYGPQGTGGIVLADAQLSISPLKVGGSGFDSYNHQHPALMPEALEAGTANAHGIAGLAAGVNYVLENSVETLCAAANELVDRFLDGLHSLSSITVYGDVRAQIHTPIVSLNVNNIDSGLVSDALSSRYGICTRPGAHCAPLMHERLGTQQQGTVRFSFSSANTAEEVDKTLEALAEITQGL